MKLIKDKKIIALIVLLLVFTIGYFVIITKMSYAFSYDYDANKSYSIVIDTIKKCATAYGEKNPDLFKDEKVIYIKVQDLIDNNLLVPNEEGNIVNPLNTEETLNTNIIKIKNEDDKISVEVDS